METRVHPLDPLSKEELEAVVATLKSKLDFGAQHLIAMVQVEEPPKSELAKFKSGKSIQRAARVTVLDKSNCEVQECVISVDGVVVSTEVIEGAKAPILSVESAMAIAAVKADPRIVAALEKRGISNVASVQMETWSIGAQIPQHLDDGRRLIWTPMWLQPEPNANFYAHPISGLHAIVDLADFSVVAVEDDPEIAIPQTPGPYRESQTGATINLKPLSIHQPEGVSFKLDGHHVKWERWNFRVGFCQREGLVLHDVWFDDEGTLRKIAHRLSIAELVIPYGDQSQGSYRKNAFDT
jgi:primary-amine oxidase